MNSILCLNPMFSKAVFDKVYALINGVEKPEHEKTLDSGENNESEIIKDPRIIKKSDFIK